jgi:hypothetical protein
MSERTQHGSGRVEGMYQNPAARLRLIEDVDVHKPTLLRTEEPGTAEVVAVLSQVGSPGRDLHQRRLGGLVERSPTYTHKGDIHGSDGHFAIEPATEHAI